MIYCDLALLNIILEVPKLGAIMLGSGPSFVNCSNLYCPTIDTARSRHGYVIMYAGCPIVWKSQLQNEIALSTTEAELIGLSYSLREAIPIMEILKEMKHYLVL